jgi:lipopolysaccharide export LptBFGC system permease protein LptF
MLRRRVWLTNRSLVTPIAEHARAPTPGFVEYIWKFALPILLPAFALVSISFFSR